ncbi:class I SAM-dependent methyltransferase [Omnitrophica bacterium]|nr:class I SAM-dependent methyltransferase [Candidatus Omnitrophota bacterium]
MKIAEKILFYLSRKPGSSDYYLQEEGDLDSALHTLTKAFPDFVRYINGKEILDFGCGTGQQSIALALNGANHVLGVDISQKALQKAKQLAMEHNVSQTVEFNDKLEDRFIGKFDIVISKDSMEHFIEPEKILDTMKKALKPNGCIMVTFGPPWFAPYGSHMNFFTKVPWVNIIFDEKTIMKVRSRFRNDGATRYEEVESGLNKMTLGRFERIISNTGFRVMYKKHECIKGVNILGTLPLIRELFINRINCILAA